MLSEDSKMDEKHVMLDTLNQMLIDMIDLRNILISEINEEKSEETNDSILCKLTIPWPKKELN